jgi:hypothetical protein
MKFRKPSASMVVALIALVMAMGGSAVAASLITSKQIKNGTIQLADISKKAQKSLKGKAGAQGPQGPAGAQGAQGAQGVQGAKGDKGDKGDTGDSATTLFAAINSDGTVVSSKASGVAGSETTGVGTYRVYFDQNISACTAQATASDLGQAPETINVGFQGSVISGAGGTNNGLFIQTANNAGTLVNSGFQLAVFC